VALVRGNARAEQQDLIDRCLTGDPAAWDLVVRTHWKRVFNIAYTFVGRYDDAEDLTQDIFVRLLRALPTYDRRANFETWLTSVSRNHCVDHYRRLRRENQRFTRDIDPEDVPLEDPLRRPDVTLEKENQVELIRKALARLSPTLRDAVALRDVHDLSYQEIAGRLELAEGTVKSRINRGRKELAKHLRVLQEPRALNQRGRRDRHTHRREV
jgi:RNA polymerase sigma-70 factor, ECF subfamily